MRVGLRVVRRTYPDHFVKPARKRAETGESHGDADFGHTERAQLKQSPGPLEASRGQVVVGSHPVDPHEGPREVSARHMSALGQVGEAKGRSEVSVHTVTGSTESLQLVE